MSLDFAADTQSVGDIRLHYKLGGPADGPPVLLWHGFLGTSHAWRKVAPALAEAGCAVLVPDMRGYGDSDKPGGVDGYDGRAVADDFRGLVRQIGFGAGQPITLVAHDMGAPPALIWAADHADEIATVHYLEEPLFVPDGLAQNIAFTPEGTRMGGLWWWFMAFAPDLPEALVVGNEERFLRWFYEHYTAVPTSIDDEAVAEYLRTFSGREGVLGALGCYRAAFKTAEQTQALLTRKVQVPIVALGGEKSQGETIRKSLQMAGETVTGGAVPNCGHFIPEEAPEVVVEHVLAGLRNL